MPETYALQDSPPRIEGRAWIYGKLESVWRFTLILDTVAQHPDAIPWSSLVPGDDVTGWLTVIPEEKRIEIHPAEARPDADIDDRIPVEAAVILGAVHASGATAVQDGEYGAWTLQFELMPWRIQGGPLHESRLTVRRRVPGGEVRPMIDGISPHDLLQILARRRGDGVELLGILGRADSDEELRDRTERLKEPRTIHDPDFGTLTLDPRLDWYEGEMDWCGSEIRLSAETDRDGSPAAALETARALSHDQTGWDARIRDCAVRTLLKLKNESWLDEGEEPITETDFRSKIKLDSITVASDREFEFWHEDGDLFWGHSIQVRGNLADGPTDAGIPG